MQCNSEKFQPGQIEFLTGNREGINATSYSVNIFVTPLVIILEQSRMFKLHKPYANSVEARTACYLHSVIIL